MSKILKEFRDFLLRGNLVELAVAFVMGVAFAAVVNSFVKNFVTPAIGAIFGRTLSSDLTFRINNSVFSYGAFITDLITFVAIAAAVFFVIVKPVDMLTKSEEPGSGEISDEERRHQELLAALRVRA